MPDELAPNTPEQLADSLREAASNEQVIELGGAFSKRHAGGEIRNSDLKTSTYRLNRVLAYEPKDLTISVEAGMPFAELERTLAENNQALPLDPPYGDRATVGGVIAVNASGPRRRRYGTARDMVIGMSFATVDGAIVDSGGMVVKNVTGLDMAKLMIGSYGTLAAMTKVNFKVFPAPPATATFVLQAPSIESAVDLRGRILKSQLQPIALDLLNRAGARALGLQEDSNFLMLAEAAGSEAVISRFKGAYEDFAVAAGAQMRSLDAAQAELTWASVRDFRTSVRSDDSALLRVSTTPSRLVSLVQKLDSELALLARAAEGVLYLGCPNVERAAEARRELQVAGFPAVVEEAPVGQRKDLEMWQAGGTQFGVFKRLKHSLDPSNALNPGRLFNLL